MVDEKELEQWNEWYAWFTGNDPEARALHASTIREAEEACRAAGDDPDEGDGSVFNDNYWFAIVDRVYAERES